jgi:hypothetical protein
MGDLEMKTVDAKHPEKGRSAMSGFSLFACCS